MQERISSLLEKVEESDKVELVMLNNAFVAALREYQVNNNRETVGYWRVIKKELSQLLDDLEEKYDMKKNPTTFKTKLAVWEHLVDNGYQISKSQFYSHCKEGLLKPAKGGGYVLRTVGRYAKLHLRLAETGRKEREDLEAKEERIKDLQLEREEVKLEKDRYELAAKQGKFVPRDEYEMAIVTRAVAFKAHLNHTIQKNVPDWIDLVGGDQARAAELVHAIAGEVDQRLADFASDAEIDVIFESE